VGAAMSRLCTALALQAICTNMGGERSVSEGGSRPRAHLPACARALARAARIVAPWQECYGLLASLLVP